MSKPHKKQENRYRACWLAFLWVACLCLSRPAMAGNDAQKVLVIHSYHQGLEWTDKITRGIISVLGADPDVDLEFEYLDTKHQRGKLYLDKMADLFHFKHALRRRDVIIAADNNALDFVRTYGQDIHADIPVVFCGINNFTPAMIQGISHVTGIEEYTNHGGTLNLMLGIHPDTRTILVVFDQSKTGQEIKKDFEKTAEYFKHRVHFDYIDHFELDSLVEKVATLEPGTLIYLTILNVDSSGRFIDYREGISKITAASKVPVYGSWDVYLGKGIVGGCITSGFDQGREAGLMALSILHGKKAEGIPIVRKTETPATVDFNRLKAFNIDEDQLPRGTIVINKPLNFWQRERRLILVLALFPLVLALVIYRKDQSQKLREKRLREMNATLDLVVHEKTRELKNVNDQLYIILNTMASPVFFKNTQGFYLGCNAAFTRLILGRTIQGMEGQSFHDLMERVPVHLAEILETGNEELMESPGVGTYEVAIPCFDGLTRDFLFNKATTTNDREEVTGFVGVMVDISKRTREEKEREALIGELHAANEKLETLSITDALTGLSNRGHITTRIKEEIRKAERYSSRFSIIMIDLDYFKSINDTYGHHVGDLALQTVARVLKENVRDIDLVGRYGGEEFMILLPSTDLESGFVIAERIRKNIESMTWKDIARLTISGGIAEYHGESETELLRKADELLYKAKAGGRNRIEKWQV